jgi:hypothetical protein
MNRLTKYAFVTSGITSISGLCGFGAGYVIKVFAESLIGTHNFFSENNASFFLHYSIQLMIRGLLTGLAMSALYIVFDSLEINKKQKQLENKNIPPSNSPHSSV